MVSKLSHHDQYSVYPGQYVPLLAPAKNTELEIQDGIDLFGLATTTELPHGYKVEVAIPGVNRDEFRVQADNNMLQVCVMHRKASAQLFNEKTAPKFNYEYFEREIILPPDADTDFISATYQAGVLCVHVPKTSQPVKNLHTNIVIY